MDRQSALRNAVLQRHMFAEGGLSEFRSLEEQDEIARIEKEKLKEEIERKLVLESATPMAARIKRWMGNRSLTEFVEMIYQGLMPVMPTSYPKKRHRQFGTPPKPRHRQFDAPPKPRHRDFGEFDVQTTPAGGGALFAFSRAREERKRRKERQAALDALIAAHHRNMPDEEEILSVGEYPARADDFTDSYKQPPTSTTAAGWDLTDPLAPVTEGVETVTKKREKYDDGSVPEDVDYYPDFESKVKAEGAKAAASADTNFLKEPIISERPKFKSAKELLQEFKALEAAGKVSKEFGIDYPHPKKTDSEEPEGEQSFFDILSDKVDLFSAGLEIAQRGAVGQYPSGSGLTGIISDVSAGLKVRRKGRSRKEKELKLLEEKEKDRKQQMEIAIIKEKGAARRERLRNFALLAANEHKMKTDIWNTQQLNKTKIQIHNASERSKANARIELAIIRARAEKLTQEYRDKSLKARKEIAEIRQKDIVAARKRAAIADFTAQKIDLFNVRNWGPEQMKIFQHPALWKGKDSDKFIHPGKGVLPKKDMEVVMASVSRNLVAHIDKKGGAKKKALKEIIKSWITLNKANAVPSDLMRRFTVRRASNKTFGNPIDDNNRANYEKALNVTLKRYEGIGKSTTPEQQKKQTRPKRGERTPQGRATWGGGTSIYQ